MFGKTTDIGNGYTYTKGFTVGFSTPFLIAAVISLAFIVEVFLRTGNWQEVPNGIFATA